ncbi:MAG: AraC family transcriptional regulator [Burkholderiaceae bacterium]|nr:AraC family transcriptional regulator [Burkholderiaceae bacterium]
MTEAPGLLTEPLELQADIGDPASPPASSPAGADVLTDVLRVFRVGGAALLRGDFRAPWSLQAPSASSLLPVLHPEAPRSLLVVFHIVVEGECWIEVEGKGRCELHAGDLVGFPRGDSHTMGSLPQRPAAASVDCGPPTPIVSLFPPPPWRDLPRIAIDGDGTATRIVCFYLRCDELLHNPLLESLPAMLVARPGERSATQWPESSVRYLVREARRPCPGSGCVIARLAELLFVEVLRMHIERLDANATGWLAALADRRLARALQAIHARPAEAWTADALARQAGVSRSVLVQRFNEVLGTSPMRYVADWRLQLAAQALLSSATVAVAAERAGYASEEAFSRAFKRRTGESPGSWRRKRLGSEGC